MAASKHEMANKRDAERHNVEALREAIRIGDESGPDVSADEVFAELRQLIARNLP
jgi:antitoxin ParD1/3/4